jgi:hypothetical protein
MEQRSSFRVLCTFKWLFFTVLSLAVTNVAGDNIAVVPVMAAVLLEDIYGVILIAYFLIGAFLAGISAWIGSVAKDELPQTVEWSGGKSAKNLVTWAILGVCIPASALTGGFFAGYLLADIIGVSQKFGALLVLLMYSLFVLYKNKRCVMWVNALSLLTIPVLIMGCLLHNQLNTGLQENYYVQINKWTLVCALVGYNAGGLRPVLLAEAGTYLSCPWTAAGIAVAAKWVEGIITLILAYSVVQSGAAGILPVGQILEMHWGLAGRMFFILSFFGIFFSCMVPAMAVNAHQIKGLTGMQCAYALTWALAIVLSITFLGLKIILGILAVTGVAATLMMLLLLWLFFRHHLMVR